MVAGRVWARGAPPALVAASRALDGSDCRRAPREELGIGEKRKCQVVSSARAPSVHEGRNVECLPRGLPIPRSPIGADMKTLSTRNRGLCRSLIGLVARMAVFPALWPAAVLAQSLVFQTHDPDWDEIELPPGEGSFGKALLCELDGNGVWDVVVVREGQVLILLDPGRRTKWVSLDPAHVLVDVARIPKGGGNRDAILTAGDNGARVWTWDESQPHPITCRFVVTE